MFRREIPVACIMAQMAAVPHPGKRVCNQWGFLKFMDIRDFAPAERGQSLAKTCTTKTRTQKL
jgi:hypothetical protein